jgi:hypothetical protein
MGHMSHMALKSHGPSAVTGMDLDAASAEVPNACRGCELGKSSRKPFLRGKKKTTCLFEVIHSDLGGPVDRSIQGSTYYATFIDDYSRHAAVYPLKSKERFVQAFKSSLPGVKPSSQKLPDGR